MFLPNFLVPPLFFFLVHIQKAGHTHQPTGFIYTLDVFTRLEEVYGIGQTRKWLIARQGQEE
jgi:hypothetical protein